ncbi:MAG: hypothetical protein ACI9KE_003400 [Polyangiales bacterium]|jgi:hypothetical protein
MNIRTGILITILAMGCGGEEEASGEAASAAEQIEAASAAASEAVEAAAVAAAENTAAAAEGTTAAAEGTAAAAGEGPQNMQEGLAALGEAMAAAQGAEGDSHCEQAYNGAMAMVAALSKQGGGAPTANIPSEESFLTGCNALPEQAQQCMTMSYAMANQETCSAVMQSPEVQAFRNQMRPE